MEKVEKTRYEITFTIASTVAIVLGTGWLLTWARLANENLPSQSILAALPRSYFLQVSIQSMLSPLVISVVLGGGWLALYLQFYPKSRASAFRRWCLFGVALSAISWKVAVLVNSAQSRGGATYVRWELGACTALILAAGCWGWLSHVYVGPSHGQGHEDWNLIRPIAGFTIVLCFFAAGLLRAVDARFASYVLPLAEVVVSTPCSELTNGRPALPTVAQVQGGAIQSGPQDGNRCEVGGYYLGESSNWIYLIQRSDPCIKHPSVPLLLDVKRENVQELVVFEEKPSPCKQPNDGGRTASHYIPERSRPG